MGNTGLYISSRTEEAAVRVARQYAKLYQQGERQATSEVLKSFAIGDGYLKCVYLPRDTTKPLIDAMGGSPSGINLLGEVDRSWRIAKAQGALAYDSKRESIIFPICTLSIKSDQAVPEIGIAHSEPSLSMGRHLCSPVLFMPKSWERNRQTIAPHFIDRRPLSHPRDDGRVEAILRAGLGPGESYPLSQVGELLRSEGFECKGVLKPYLQQCDFADLSQVDEASGQPLFRFAEGAPSTASHPVLAGMLSFPDGWYGLGCDEFFKYVALTKTQESILKKKLGVGAQEVRRIIVSSWEAAIDSSAVDYDRINERVVFTLFHDMSAYGLTVLIGVDVNSEQSALRPEPYVIRWTSFPEEWDATRLARAREQLSNLQKRAIWIALYEQYGSSPTPKTEIGNYIIKVFGFDYRRAGFTHLSDLLDELDFVEEIGSGDSPSSDCVVKAADNSELLTEDEASWLHGLLVYAFGLERFSALQVELLLMPAHSQPVFDFRSLGITGSRLCGILTARGVLEPSGKLGPVDEAYVVVEGSPTSPFEGPSGDFDTVEKSKAFLKSNIVAGGLRCGSRSIWAAAYNAAGRICGFASDSPSMLLGRWLIQTGSFPKNEQAILLGYTDQEAILLRHKLGGAGAMRLDVPEALRYTEGVPELALPIALLGMHSYWKERPPHQCYAKALHCALLIDDTQLLIRIAEDYKWAVDDAKNSNDEPLPPLLNTGKNMLKTGRLSDAFAYFSLLNEMWPKSVAIAAWHQFARYAATDCMIECETIEPIIMHLLTEPDLIGIILEKEVSQTLISILSSIAKSPDMCRAFLGNAAFSENGVARIATRQYELSTLISEEEYCSIDVMSAYVLLQGVTGDLDSSFITNLRTTSMAATEAANGSINALVDLLVSSTIDDSRAVAAIEENQEMLLSSRLRLDESLDGQSAISEELYGAVLDFSHFRLLTLDILSSCAPDDEADSDKAQSYLQLAVKMLNVPYASERTSFALLEAMAERIIKLVDNRPRCLDAANCTSIAIEFQKVYEAKFSEFVQSGRATLCLCKLYCYSSSLAARNLGKATLAAMYWEERLMLKGDGILERTKGAAHLWDSGGAFEKAMIECEGIQSFRAFCRMLELEVSGRNRRSPAERNAVGYWKSPKSVPAAIYSFIQTGDDFFIGSLATLAYKNRNRRLTLLARLMDTGPWQIANVTLGIRDLFLDDRGMPDDRISNNLTSFLLILSDFVEDELPRAIDSTQRLGKPEPLKSVFEFFPTVLRCVRSIEERHLFTQDDPRQLEALRHLVGSLRGLDGLLAANNETIRSLIDFLESAIVEHYDTSADDNAFAEAISSLDSSRLVELFVHTLEREDAPLARREYLVGIILDEVRGRDDMPAGLSDWMIEVSQTDNSDERLCALSLLLLGIGDARKRGDNAFTVINRYVSTSGDRYFAIYCACKFFEVFCREDRRNDLHLMSVVKSCMRIDGLTFDNAVPDMDDILDQGVLRLLSRTHTTAAEQAPSLLKQRERLDVSSAATALLGEETLSDYGKTVSRVMSEVVATTDSSTPTLLQRGVLFRNWGPLIDHLCDANDVNLAGSLGILLRSLYKLRAYAIDRVVLRRADRFGCEPFQRFVETVDETGEMLRLLQVVSDMSTEEDLTIRAALDCLLAKTKVLTNGPYGPVNSLMVVLNDSDTMRKTFSTCRPFSLVGGNVEWIEGEANGLVSVKDAISLVARHVIPQLELIDYFQSSSLYKMEWLSHHFDDGFLLPQSSYYLRTLHQVFSDMIPGQIQAREEISRGLARISSTLPEPIAPQALVLARAVSISRKPRVERGTSGRFSSLQIPKIDTDELHSVARYARRMIGDGSEVADGSVGSAESYERLMSGSVSADQEGFYIRSLLSDYDFLDTPKEVALLLMAFRHAMRDSLDTHQGTALPRERMASFSRLLSYITKSFSRAELDALVPSPKGEQPIWEWIADRFLSRAFIHLSKLAGEPCKTALQRNSFTNEMARYVDECNNISQLMGSLDMDPTLSKAFRQLAAFPIDDFLASVQELEFGDACTAIEQLQSIQEGLHTAYLPALNLAARIGMRIESAERSCDALVQARIEDNSFDGTVHLFFHNMSNVHTSYFRIDSVQVKSDADGTSKGISLDKRMAIPADGLDAERVCLDSIEHTEGKLRVTVAFSASGGRSWTVEKLVETQLEPLAKLPSQSVIGGYSDRSRFRDGLGKVAFVGREKELEDLSYSIRNAADMGANGVVLYGPKGVGKTTLALKLMQQERERRTGLVFVALTAKRSDTAASLLSYALEELEDLIIDGEIRGLEAPPDSDASVSLLGLLADAKEILVSRKPEKPKEGKKQKKPKEDKERKQFTFSNRTTSRKLARSLGIFGREMEARGHRVIFVIDESQELLGTEQVDEFTAMCETVLPRAFSFLFLGTGKLMDVLTPKITVDEGGMASFFLGCLRIDLHHFEGPDCQKCVRAMMMNPRVVGSLTYSDDAVRYLSLYTGGHARSCATIGNAIIEKVREGRIATSGTVFASDVKSACVESAGKTPLVGDFNGEFSHDDAAKEVVRALCMGICLDGRKDMTSGDILDLIGQYPLEDYQLTNRECSRALASLLARDYLSYDEETASYSFASYLFRDFVNTVFGDAVRNRMNGSPITRAQSLESEERLKLAWQEGYNKGTYDALDKAKEFKPIVNNIHINEMNVVASQVNLLGDAVQRLMSAELSPDDPEITSLLGGMSWPGDNRFLPSPAESSEADEEELQSISDEKYRTYILEGCDSGDSSLFGDDLEGFRRWLEMPSNGAALMAVGIDWRQNSLFQKTLSNESAFSDEMLATCKSISVAALLHSFLSQVNYDNFSPVAALLGPEVEHVWKSCLINALRENSATSLMLLRQNGSRMGSTRGVQSLSDLRTSQIDRLNIGAICQLGISFPSYYNSRFPRPSTDRERDSVYPVSFASADYEDNALYGPFSYGTPGYQRVTNLDMLSIALSGGQLGYSPAAAREEYRELATYFGALCCVRSLRNHAAHGGRYERGKFSEQYSRQLFAILVSDCSAGSSERGNDIAEEHNHSASLPSVWFQTTHGVYPNSKFGSPTSRTIHEQAYWELSVQNCQMLYRTYDMAQRLSR